MEDASCAAARLPHRFPFLMVDKVLEVIPGKRAVAVKNVTKDGPFCGRGKGSAWPSLLIIEAMAQVGALAASPVDVDQAGGRQTPGYLAAMTDVRFGRTPEVGDSVLMALDFEAGMGGLVRFRGIAEIDGEMAVDARLTFTLPQTSDR